MRQLGCSLFVALVLVSCRDRVICPAFQSTYILDDSVRNAYFSYAWYLNPEERNTKPSLEPEILPPDSLGAIVASTGQNADIDYVAYTTEYKILPRRTKKTKYGIIKRTPIIPNLVTNLQLKTVPMENVLTPSELQKDEESIPVPADSSVLASLSATTTIAVQDSSSVSLPDSTTMVTTNEVEEKKKDWIQFKYGFNPLSRMQPDQAYYFKRYGWLLQNTAPREKPADTLQLQTNSVDSLSSDSTIVQVKGLKDRFEKKNKRKKKKEERKKKKTPVSDLPIKNDETTKPNEGDEKED